MAAGDIHISLAAEPIFEIGGMHITNSMFTSTFLSLLLIVFAYLVKIKIDPNTNQPKGLQNIAEWFVELFFELIQTVTGNIKKTRLFLPPVMTFFLFIIINNWFGLMPGVGPIMMPVIETESQSQQKDYAKHDSSSQLSLVSTAEANFENIQENQNTSDTDVISINDVMTNDSSDDAKAGILESTSALEKEGKDHYGPVMTPIFRPGTADLNTTLALGIISVLFAQIFGVSFNHLGYFKKFINFSNPIMFFVGILETISEFAKIISFGFRLFGNIFAGEVLLVVISFLAPLVIPIPFYGLEIFVGMIQALVFSMLSLVFFNIATQSHDH